MVEYGTFMWNELVTADQQRAGDFYCDLLGWTRKAIDSGPYGIYTLFQKDGRDVAGMMNPTEKDYAPEARPPRWSAYIAVDDIEGVASSVPKLGGRVLVPVQEVPDTGRVCMIADPTGAVVLLMQPTTQGD